MRWSALLLLAAALFLRAEPLCAADAPPPLRKGDALLVRIEGLGGGLPEYREIVDSDGRVELPFIGFHVAEGKTLPELAAEMAAVYADAGLASNASVQITFATHFDPPPQRSVLIRSKDPRRPVPSDDLSVPAADPPAPAP